MKEIILTNNVVLISFVQDLLQANGVLAAVFDTNASIIEGSLGILPRRVMVLEDDYEVATALLRAEGLENELSKVASEDAGGIMSCAGGLV